MVTTFKRTWLLSESLDITLLLLLFKEFLFDDLCCELLKSFASFLLKERPIRTLSEINKYYIRNKFFNIQIG